MNDYSQMIQNINISLELGRKELLELGRKPPYFNLNYFKEFYVLYAGVARIDKEFVYSYTTNMVGEVAKRP